MEIKRKTRDAPFLAVVVLTLIMAASVVWGVHRAKGPISLNPKVDAQEIDHLVERGALSHREAEFYEKVRK